MLPEQKLDALVSRHKTVETELASQVTPDTYVKLSREFAELGPIVEAVNSYREVIAEHASGRHSNQIVRRDHVGRHRQRRARAADDRADGDVGGEIGHVIKPPQLI